MARAVKYKFGKLNNRDDPSSLGYFEDKRTQLINVMTEAVNVDIFDEDTASLRDGFTQLSADPCHSAFCTNDEQDFYMVSNGSFCRLNADYSISPIRALAVDTRVWMENINGVVLASNGQEIFAVSGGNLVSLPTPVEKHEVAFPAAKYLAFYNGVTYGATADGLVMTKAYSLMADERRLTIPLPGITMVAPVTDGLWVGTRDKVYWLAGGGDDEFSLVEKSSFGVIEGAFSRFNSSVVVGGAGTDKAVLMATAGGICVGRSGGALENKSEDGVSIGDGSSGCCYVRETKGTVFFLVSIVGSSGINVFSGAEYVTNELNYK